MKQKKIKLNQLWGFSLLKIKSRLKFLEQLIALHFFSSHSFPLFRLWLEKHTFSTKSANLPHTHTHSLPVHCMNMQNCPSCKYKNWKWNTGQLPLIMLFCVFFFVVVYLFASLFNMIKCFFFMNTFNSFSPK